MQSKALSVQTEDCYCVPVYSFWKHNQIDMERVQKAYMVISRWKGVKIHCRSQNNTSQSLHWNRSTAHTKTKKRSWCCSKLEVSGSRFCSLCRLGLLWQTEAETQGENIPWAAMPFSLYHPCLGEGFVELQKTGFFMKVTLEEFIPALPLIYSWCVQEAELISNSFYGRKYG